ncbi:hypothetical protein PUN28_000745 [Cardiocondyla obscurior]|uniref:Uncharacterized protein n=1 Tax=Cardiocondyla obscurior TaxID=286306 RepID=A0AAW2H116_9HYME
MSRKTEAKENGKNVTRQYRDLVMDKEILFYEEYFNETFIKIFIMPKTNDDLGYTNRGTIDGISTIMLEHRETIVN